MNHRLIAIGLLALVAILPMVSATPTCDTRSVPGVVTETQCVDPDGPALVHGGGEILNRGLFWDRVPNPL